MTNEERVAAIKQRLTAVLKPSQLEVLDESHKHIGHAGAKSGKGHFAVSITAAAFAGKSRLVMHRMVYDALGELMQDEIHALVIRASSGV